MPSALSAISLMQSTSSMPSAPASEPSTISSITLLISPPSQRAPALPQSAMIASPSLPPVPAKAVEKIVKHQFVEIKKLMPDNSALILQLAALGLNQPVSSEKLREINDPLTWVFYFLSFLAISVFDRRTRELAAYGQVIVHIAQRHGGKGWQAYDRIFRQQIAAGASHPWAELCPSLMAATVLASGHTGKGQSCLLCNGSDHDQNSCALLTSETKKPRTEVEPCRAYNRGECKLQADVCKFAHTCLLCRTPHPLSSCTGTVSSHSPSDYFCPAAQTSIYITLRIQS